MKKIVALVASVLNMSASATEYSVGQIWEYKTRTHEATSRLYIVHIDEHEKIGKIYHIYVEGVKIKNTHIECGIQDVLPHAPVDIKTLKLSLTRMIGTTKSLPDISDGYAVWKEAFDSGEGGVFNITVNKIIQYIEEVAGQKA
jgi:hypothetical protein